MPLCPQTLPSLNSDYAMLIQWDLHVGGMSEDCLSLNVWTPGVNDGQKRAVMVSFYGGGFATGSGNGPQYDGAQLARFGDIDLQPATGRAPELAGSRSWRGADPIDTLPNFYAQWFLFRKLGRLGSTIGSTNEPT